MKNEKELRALLSEMYIDLQAGRGSVALQKICDVQQTAYDQGLKDGTEEERLNEQIAAEANDC